MVSGSRWNFQIDPLHWHGRNTLFVESKSKAARVQQEQKDMHAKLRQRGYDTHVVRSMQEFRKLIKMHGIPTREAKSLDAPVAGLR